MTKPEKKTDAVQALEMRSETKLMVAQAIAQIVEQQRKLAESAISTLTAIMESET